MILSIKKYAIISGSLLIAAIPSVNASECSYLLRDGVRNEVRVTGLSMSNGMLHTAMCDSTVKVIETSRNSGKGSSYGIGVGGYSFSFGSSKSTAEEFKSMYEHQACSSLSSELSTFQQDILESSIIDSNMVNSFVECKALEERGLIVTPKPSPFNETTLNFDIKFEGDPDGETINGYSINPSYAASCESDFVEGPREVDT